jgi:hypothetical protein
MGWTATKTIVSKDQDMVSVTVQYTNGVTSFSETYKASGIVGASWIPDIVANKILNLNAANNLTIITGPVTPTPVIIPDETFLQFQLDLRRLDIILKLIQAKALDATDTKVVAFVNRIKNALPTYWDKI